MAQARNALCALVIIVLVAVPLAGWLGSENGPVSAQAGRGVLGGFVGRLKREDDEAEVKEIAEHESTPEDREQAREQTERVQLEATQAQEQERQPEHS
jgi:Sec-independent protein translocase protein TatA